MNNIDLNSLGAGSSIKSHSLTEAKTPLVSWAILGLAFFFVSSHLSVGLTKHFGLPMIATYAISILSLVPLWWRKLRSPPADIKNSYLNFIIIVICFFSCLSSLNSIGLSDFGVAAKTLGLLMVLLTLLACAPSYQAKEIQHSLLIYSLGELALFILTLDQWNPNAFSNRTATSAATFFYTCPIRLIGIVSFCAGLYFTIRSGSRTVTMAAILAICSTSSLGPKTRNRSLIFAVLIFLAVMTAIFAGPIQHHIRKLATASLSSKSSVAQFFLNDKSREDIRVGGDFFDRAKLWTQSIKIIKMHPILGVGLGNESKYVLINKKRSRSHNAWLSLALEGGIPVTIFWALLYFYLGYFWVFNSRHHLPEELQSLNMFLLTFMLFASLMESSGIGSLQSPSNIICLFLAFNSAQSLEYSHNCQQI